MYSKTVIIISHNGNKVLRTFQSETTLTDAKITSILDRDGSRDNAAGVYIMDTPQSEVVPQSIKVYVGGHMGDLYLNCTVDGQEGPFWKLPGSINKLGLLSIMVETQQTGIIVGKTTPDDDWRDGKEHLRDVATYDDNQVIFHLDTMSIAVKRRLGFGLV